MTENKKLNIFSPFTLCLVVLVFSINAFYNYEIKLAGDEYQYILMSEGIMQGKLIIPHPLYEYFKDQEQKPEMFNINSKGEPVSWYAIGVAYVVTPFYALFKEQIFWILPLFFGSALLVLLYILSYIVAKELKNKYPYLGAIIAVGAYGTIINFRLGFRRDLIASSIMLLLSIAVFNILKKRGSRDWYYASFLMALLTVIKINFILLYAPLIIIMFFSSPKFMKQPEDHIKLWLKIISITLFVFIPFFIHNHISTGHWYLLTQATEAKSFNPFNDARPGLFKNIIALLSAQSHIYSVNGLPLWSSILFVVMAIFGAISFRNEKFIKYWLIPSILIFYSFYSLTFRRPFIYNTYLAPIYPYMVLLFTQGIIKSVQMFKFNTKLALLIIAFLAISPFLFIKTIRSLPGKRYHHFQISNAKMLSHDIESVIPAGSVIICDKFLSYTIDIFSSSSCLPFSFMGEDMKGIENIRMLLNKGVKVYYSDYVGITAYKMQDNLQKIKSHFSLNYIKSIDDLHSFPSTTNSSSMNLYSITLLEK